MSPSRTNNVDLYITRTYVREKSCLNKLMTRYEEESRTEYHVTLRDNNEPMRTHALKYNWIKQELLMKWLR